MKVTILARRSSSRHAAPGLRILRLQQQREQIARRRLRRLRSACGGAAMMSSTALAKNASVAAPPQAPDARQEFRRAEQVERIEPAEGVEVARHRAAGIRWRRAPRPWLNSVCSSTRSVRRAISTSACRCRCAAGARRSRSTRGAGDAVHGGGEIGDLPRRKQRRQRAALRAPGLALDREQAVPRPGLNTRSCSASLR